MCAQLNVHNEFWTRPRNPGPTRSRGHRRRGVAVVAHGASLMTKDFDILYALGKENVARLKLALDELDAVAYGDSRRLKLA